MENNTTIRALYLLFENWTPERTFILLEEAKEVWRGNWNHFPDRYHHRYVESFWLDEEELLCIEMEVI